MQTNENQNSTQQNSIPSVSPGNYSPVTVYMKDTIGVIFMGIFSLLLLIGWMRAETRNRRLITQKEISNGSN